MLRVYYNENDLRAVAWLKQLMMEDLIPEGDIDERSIVDVRGSDVAGYDQCHWFAGVGGWAYALRLAGWGDRPVWTASCPCQPWSQAGKGKGEQDERHLWPALRSLIAVCAPPTIIGEQVPSKAGRGWLSGVRSDLETLAYVVGASDLCSASVRSPNIRQRLYWVANASSERGRENCRSAPSHEEENGGTRRITCKQNGDHKSSGDCAVGRVADAGHERTGRAANSLKAEDGRSFCDTPGRCNSGRVGDPDDAGREGRSIDPREYADQLAAWEASPIGRLGNPDGAEWRACHVGCGYGSEGGDDPRKAASGARVASQTGGVVDANGDGYQSRGSSAAPTRYWSALDPAGSIGVSLAEVNRRNAAGFWDRFDVVECTDSQARRIESTPVEMVDGIPSGVVRGGDPGAPFDESGEAYSRFPLVIGAEARSMRLRGYGNSINPVLAAEFVMAFLEAEELL